MVSLPKNLNYNEEKSNKNKNEQSKTQNKEKDILNPEKHKRNFDKLNEKENKLSTSMDNGNNEGSKISYEGNPIELDIIDGPETIKGTKIIINDKGIMNSKGNINEGYTYFGCASQNHGSQINRIFN